jgi:hypothetical protein
MYGIPNQELEDSLSTSATASVGSRSADTPATGTIFGRPVNRGLSETSMGGIRLLPKFLDSNFAIVDGAALNLY